MKFCFYIVAVFYCSSFSDTLSWLVTTKDGGYHSGYFVETDTTRLSLKTSFLKGGVESDTISVFLYSEIDTLKYYDSNHNKIFINAPITERKIKAIVARRNKEVASIEKNNLTGNFLYAWIIKKDGHNNSGYITKAEDKDLFLKSSLNNASVFSIDYSEIYTLLIGNTRISAPVTKEKIEQIPVDSTTTKPVLISEGLPKETFSGNYDFKDKVQLTNNTNIENIPSENRPVFGVLTIIGGAIVGICEIVYINNPRSTGLGDAINIAIPFTLICAGIGLLCK